MIRKTVLGVAVIAALVSSNAVLAQPVTFATDDTGRSVSLDYNGFSGGRAIDELGASATFTMTGVEDGLHGETPTRFFNFDYSIANTSSIQSSLSGFAFRTNPDNYVIGFTTGAFEDFEGASSYSDGIGPVGACFGNFGDPSSCENATGGILPGDFGFGSFRLGFYDAIDFLTFDDFFVRYDSVDGPDDVTSASGRGSVPVPEPGMLALFAFGMSVLVARQRGGMRR